MVYESDLDGILHTVAQEGQTLPVGELIAHVGEAAAAGEGDGPTLAGPAGLDAQGGAAPVPAPGPPVAPAPVPGARDGGGERGKASPLARRIARERGGGPGAGRGGGPGGGSARADGQA